MKGDQGRGLFSLSVNSRVRVRVRAQAGGPAAERHLRVFVLQHGVISVLLVVRLLHAVAYLLKRLQ